MPTTVTITLGRDLSQEEKDMLRALVCDAFWEFQRSRGPSTEEYVANRYPSGEGYIWLNRSEKIAEINRRKALAEELRNSAAAGRLTTDGLTLQDVSEVLDEALPGLVATPRKVMEMLERHLQEKVS